MTEFKRPPPPPPFVHFCEHCGSWGAFGRRSKERPGGYWYCRAHLPGDYWGKTPNAKDVEALIIETKEATGRADADPKPKERGDLFDF